MRTGLERYFYFAAASGRDVLLGEKDASAASTGGDLVDQERSVAEVFKHEYMLDFSILLLLAEVMGHFVELYFRLSITVENRRQQE